MSQSIEINVKTPSASDLPSRQSLRQLLPEIVAVLQDSHNVLAEILRVDLAHSGGFAERLGERLARVEKLLDALNV
jgi:hypothetical protein